MKTPLKRARARLNITAVAAASAIGIDQGHYSRIENGSRCSVDYAERISRFFSEQGVRLSELQILYPARYTTPKSKVSEGRGKKPANVLRTARAR